MCFLVPVNALWVRVIKPAPIPKTKKTHHCMHRHQKNQKTIFGNYGTTRNVVLFFFGGCAGLVNLLFFFVFFNVLNADKILMKKQWPGSQCIKISIYGALCSLSMNNHSGTGCRSQKEAVKARGCARETEAPGLSKKWLLGALFAFPMTHSPCLWLGSVDLCIWYV